MDIMVMQSFNVQNKKRINKVLRRKKYYNFYLWKNS